MAASASETAMASALKMKMKNKRMAWQMANGGNHGIDQKWQQSMASAASGVMKHGAISVISSEINGNKQCGEIGESEKISAKA
jgi:hypothetical protein